MERRTGGEVRAESWGATMRRMLAVMAALGLATAAHAAPVYRLQSELALKGALAELGLSELSRRRATGCFSGGAARG